MGQHKRNVGIDLLKCIAMFCITVQHILGQGGVIANCTPLSIDWNVAYILMSICYCCGVNCFALASGYVMTDKKVTFKQWFALWLKVEFYSVLITVLFAAINPDTVGISQIIKSILPVTFGQWWYISGYTVLFLFIPVINCFIKNAEKKTAAVVLVLSFAVLSVLGTIGYSDAFSTNNGCSPWWLIVLYLIGGYIKKYNIDKRVSIKISSLVFAACVIFTWLARLTITVGTDKLFGRVLLPDILMQNISPNVLIASVMFLIMLSKVKIEKVKIANVISGITAMSLSVYLIHVHPLVFGNLIKNDLFASFPENNAAVMVLLVMASGMAVFIACLFIDYIKTVLFRLSRIDKLIDGVSAFAERQFLKLKFFR